MILSEPLQVPAEQKPPGQAAPSAAALYRQVPSTHVPLLAWQVGPLAHTTPTQGSARNKEGRSQTDTPYKPTTVTEKEQESMTGEDDAKRAWRVTTVVPTLNVEPEACEPMKDTATPG